LSGDARRGDDGETDQLASVECAQNCRWGVVVFQGSSFVAQDASESYHCEGARDGPQPQQHMQTMDPRDKLDRLEREYPWINTPLVVGAPMRLIALSKLACGISNAGGLGFIGAGNDVSTLEHELQESRKLLQVEWRVESPQVLPVGVGFLLWAGDKLLQDALPILERHTPAAVWLFADEHPDQLATWTKECRRVTGNKTKIWIQVGTVADALQAVETCQPDVLVVQGSDAGGHGLEKCAGLITLLPEVDDNVDFYCSGNYMPKPVLIAAGGIMDSRGVAAALALGASGVVMGTRYLTCPESNVAQGYQDAVLRASDGGVNTARGKLYDSLRGTTDWPARYGGRSVLNESWHDAAKGMSFEENKKLHDEALKKGDQGWGEKARLTTYAGTGVGLVRDVKSAATVTRDASHNTIDLMERISGRLSDSP
jgi:nitronate monooxygenase